jgi:hypothetical protein
MTLLRVDGDRHGLTTGGDDERIASVERVRGHQSKGTLQGSGKVHR